MSMQFTPGSSCLTERRNYFLEIRKIFLISKDIKYLLLTMTMCWRCGSLLSWWRPCWGFYWEMLCLCSRLRPSLCSALAARRRWPGWLCWSETSPSPVARIQRGHITAQHRDLQFWHRCLLIYTIFEEGAYKLQFSTRTFNMPVNEDVCEQASKYQVERPCLKASL